MIGIAITAKSKFIFYYKNFFKKMRTSQNKYAHFYHQCCWQQHPKSLHSEHSVLILHRNSIECDVESIQDSKLKIYLSIMISIIFCLKNFITSIALTFKVGVWMASWEAWKMSSAIQTKRLTSAIMPHYTVKST